MDIRQSVKTIFFLSAVLFTLSVMPAVHTRAQNIDELKTKITSRAGEIEALEKEIAQYQIELNSIGEEKQSLQKEVRTIDLTRKKLSADIKLTENKIEESSFTIEKLEFEIGDKKEDIINKVEVIKGTIRKINEIDNNTLVELVLSSDNISEFWNDVENFAQFQESISKNVKELQDLKTRLEENKTSIEIARANSIALRVKLQDQKTIADNSLNQKNQLLAQTKNKEANYQKTLNEKLRLKEEFEKELLKFESELRIAIDPTSLPPAGTGVLLWPLKDVFITQKFGNTDFAKSGAYSGKGHNGIDFRASVGTEVKAALSGVVEATGNTDQYPGCYSYGKWVLIKHNNGLSTLYAHLSLIKAVAGQQVSTADVIGYSGNTGYSTGPHLHFTVYASQGVKVTRLGDIAGRPITKCSSASIPVAPLNAYLNPLDYL
ncbi:MAG: peptidoglycan DD-metalloendopeptidase family protein [Patescibacteria group bacterium]|nr:peptidoglycan DD-metalloendopeptidase family protein [Patescibacteria group bacterium]